MTITLQDLQVLNEKANLKGKPHGQSESPERLAFRIALIRYYESGALQRLAELADRHEHDCPTFREFFNKYALGSKLPPSCLMCGRIVHERAVEHAELPDIYICADCKQLAEDGERYRWLRGRVPTSSQEGLHFHFEAPMHGGGNLEATLEIYRKALDAAIDSARAPSVKEEK
jgi:hypothetical protein